MVLEIKPELVPIHFNEQGTAYVGQTRVLLSSVIHRFLSGDTPNEIIDAFDSLDLADVYSVIAYYLHHREDVNQYIQQEKDKGQEKLKALEKQHPQTAKLQQRLENEKRKKAAE